MKVNKEIHLHKNLRYGNISLLNYKNKYMSFEKLYSPDAPTQKNNTPTSEKKYNSIPTDKLQQQEKLSKEIEKPSDKFY